MKTPEKNNVGKAFDGLIRYKAPVFQRYYVWEQDQLRALLDDVENAAGDSTSQFIGAIVVQDLGKRSGPQSPTEYLMIDGQQRLTTIYLLICGIAAAYHRSGHKSDALSLARNYLAYTVGDKLSAPKLLPTYQDRKQLYDILRTEVSFIEWTFGTDSPDETSRRTGIIAQWRRIKDHIDEAFHDVRGRLLKSRVATFLRKLLDHIEMIQIILEPSDDANTVFSKLNFLGIPLSIADLVRNDLFARFATRSASAVSRFYDDTWTPFEKSFPNDSFESFIPIFGVIKFKGNCPKATAFPKLQSAWSRTSPEKIVREMQEYSGLFSVLEEFTEISKFPNDVNEQIRRICYMPKTTVTWPYVIQVLHAFRAGTISKKETIRAIHLVESFLVRRAIIGLEPTGLHAVFKGLWNKAGANIPQLKEKIVTSTIRCPKDGDLSQCLKTENMYARQITPYLLLQRELSFNKRHGYDNATSNYSAEHVMPKHYTSPWTSVVSLEEHRSLLHTIGNLLPLTKEQNSKIRDASWGDKRSVLRGSNWKVSQQAAATKNWNAQTIRKRTAEFTRWALAEWPEVESF